jgi:putative YhbY family RNA-binding protein
MLILTPTERRALRAQAHTLSPVVIIGQHGLTPAVLREIDHALNAHELIKVRIFSDERAEREALQLAVCHKLACAPVQHLGKLIVLWRPAPPKAEAKPPKHPAKKTTTKASLPGAISRHGQALKPLSARQARQQTQQPEWQPTWQPRNSGRKPFSDKFTDESSTTRRRSPQPAGRGSQEGSVGVSPASRRLPRSASHGSAVIASTAKQSSRRSPSHTDRDSRSSQPRSSHPASGKSPFQQAKPPTKPAAKPFAKQAARQPRGASGTSYSASKQLTNKQLSGQQPTTRRRLGGRGKE